MFKRGIHIVYAIGVVSAAPLYAVPVVPNFTQGSMTSTTTQTITTSETINSMDYATGWTYSVTGHGVEVEEGTTISPDVISTHSNTVDGVTSTWTGLDLNSADKPNWRHCLLYTSPSPRDVEESRMPSSA